MLTKKCLQIRIIYYFHNEVVPGWNLTSSSTIIIKLLLIIQYINIWMIFLFINNTLISKINVVEFIESQLHSFKK